VPPDLEQQPLRGLGLPEVGPVNLRQLDPRQVVLWMADQVLFKCVPPLAV